MDYNTSSTALWSGLPPSPEKSSQILIRDYPHRAIAIASNAHALILRHSAAANDGADGFGSLSARTRTNTFESHSSKCMVEFSPNSNNLLNDYRPLTPRPIYGTLGLISIGRDVFLCVITQASRVATIRPGETVERIEAVQFFCLNTADYDDIIVDAYNDVDSDAASVYGQGLGRNQIVEHPCQELQKLLGNGTFYYSTDFDVTNRMQDRPADAEAFNIDNFDESFLWNSFMIRPLVEFRSRLQQQAREDLDASRILTSAIRGFCRSWAIPQSSAPLRTGKTGLPSYLTVTSRLSCKRAGTRFNARGIDDDGNVANFVETETTYWSPEGVVFSYVQVRGSVPVFWEQAAVLMPNQQKISITRSADGTQPAFDKHFSDLEKAYGAVHVINLLSASKPGEAELTNLYRAGIHNCPLSRPEGVQSRNHALLRDTEYDFHAETKGPQGYMAANEIRRYIEGSADGFAYYLAHESEDPRDTTGTGKAGKPRRYVVVLQQEGVFRTNCLDCLDRTNLIQTIVSQMAVEAFLGHRGEKATSDFWSRHSNLWADNGDSLSKIYAGTGALKSSFTRHGKMSLAGAIADVRKSATRLYHNNFTDKGRQNTIDTLLGRLVGQASVVLYDPISDYVSGELQRRSGEFSTNETINIFVGTFNLNGRTDGIDDDLSVWLCPPELGTKQPEIIAIGFQEIVELNPQQIMNSDPTRKQLWEQAIKRTLDHNYSREEDEKYVLLRSGQLVGAALCIFVKASVLPHIKNVEGSVKKTGMSGMAGNKGAVAIRLDYANTPICFVTAHLAAGFANYDERNRDYATIDQGLRFQRNRGIVDHESVIWFGDFNYRIGLGLESAKELVRQRDLERLFENDQLNLQMVAGLAFQYYSEARIMFMPTYKYDVGTDEFDSSEKARIPAWTDRILRKGTNLRQLAYNSAPLRFSDHRPVYAIFECKVNIVNERLREKISRQIYDRRRAEVGGGTANLAAEESDEEDLIGYEAIEPGLPPSSSDRKKWWLENGKMARSSINPPKPETPAYITILNPKRPTNPYVPTDEPDWVNVPRSESRLSSFSSMSTSPYEHVNFSALLSSSASSTVPRKLPPPYDPSALPAKLGRKPVGEDLKTAQSDVAPPPPPPRRQTGMSTGSTMNPTAALQQKRVPVANVLPVLPTSVKPLEQQQSQPAQQPIKHKPAPPVAKKPAHLAASVSPPTRDECTSSTPDLKALRESLEHPLPGLPRRSTSAVSGSLPNRLPFRNESVREESPPPQPPRRANTGASITPSGRSTPAGGIPLVGLTAQTSTMEPKPQLPFRKPVTVQSAPVKVTPPPPPAPRKPVATSTVDLLGDDAGMEVGGWEALKPST
ncbi:putative inositol-1,4,5-trisphosphate 5-phosphatase [Triangularia verruculosa]|uniref:phosphoinositide 5-phosphatase n=1 Tax=Triangularia verruculosa TaxID=2587418 RepID=A0AAN7AUI6_9PEZI|nr:putative inositol-1,4,5-trisphosphate 5-phosphatase [Triangularia verruculosa]